MNLDAACDAPLLLQWDTVESPGEGCDTWVLAERGGGLRAQAALETAVRICLRTDKACPDNHPLAKYAEGDRRGWWGDGVDVRADLGEDEMGSLLWLLERSVANEESARWAKSFADDALATLLRQGAVARIDTAAGVLPEHNGIWLDVALYGRDGAKVFDRRFDVVWRQTFASAVAAPLATPVDMFGRLLDAGGDLGAASASAFDVVDLGAAALPPVTSFDLGLLS